MLSLRNSAPKAHTEPSSFILRHNNKVRNKFPELSNLDMLNGTVVFAAQGGVPDFETVMGRFMSKKSAHKVVYCVVDVIYINGHSIANKPLTERKNMLLDINLEHYNVFVIEGLQGNGLAYFKLPKKSILKESY